MSIQPDIQKPANDPYGLVGAHWVIESENAYRMAEEVASDAATSASRHAQSAADAESKMVDEKGKTAQSVSVGYSSSAGKLREQAVNYNTISAWMSDASGKVLGAKKHIVSLVMAGTQDIRAALDSEIAGTPVTPSSTALTDRYRNDIAAVATKLIVELDAIGHSLAGDPGASTTPTYVRAAESPKTPTVEQAAVHHSITGEGPHAEPHQLPEMPRATSAPSGTESSSSPSAPSSTTSPHIANPILSNLVAGNTSPSGSSSTTPSAKSPSGTPASAPAGQAHQSPEQRQQIRPPALPRIPLPDIPAAAQTIATAVSSTTASQLPMAPSTPTLPASTGLTPGTSGTAPVPSAPPAGLSPIGGLTPPPVTQTAPAPQGAPPGTPQAGPQAPSAPQQSPVRGPAADLGWIQRTYGLAPGVELPKSENPLSPALFIAELPESEATLHRVLASLRHQFEAAGWGQPMAVGLIKRGLETRLVYVTADAISIHPHGVLLPQGVTPLDEMTSAPATSELSGSLMVTEKLVAMIPREWTVEGVLSTVSGGEGSQSAEQFQQLVEAGELLPCTVSRGRNDVEVDEALSVFVRAALGSGGCGELDAESVRLRGARWVGVQPQGYLDSLARWYLSDAAEAMSLGRWGEAVYSAEKYMSVRYTERQVA